MANIRNHIILPLLLCSGLTVSQGLVDLETPSFVKPLNSSLSGEWVLDFSDEFNGSEVNVNKWNIDDSPKSRTPRPKIGIGSWFWRPQNVEVKNGNLVLKVTKESASKMHCGSVNSNGKYLTTYGYFEVRIKIADVTKGTHTAFWLQGPGMSNVDGTANDGAEIDVFESAWTGEFTKSVVHIDGYGENHQANTKQYSTPGIHSGYHVWGFYWTEHFMNIYYDGVLKVQYTEDKWIVRAPEYLWLSDGASFGVEGDSFFKDQPLGFLTEAYVDYIRVWKPKSTIVNSDSNLIINGDFEETMNNWTRNNTDISSLSSIQGFSGNACRMPGAQQSRNISQQVNVTPGKSYRFSFSGRIQNTHDPINGNQPNNNSTFGVATLLASVKTISGVELLKLSTQSNTNDNLTGVFTVPENVFTISVEFSKEWNVVYIDNVILNETTINTAELKKQNSEFTYLDKSSNTLISESGKSITQIDIFNLNGQKISGLSKQFSNHTSINLNHIPHNAYLAKVIYADGSYTIHKFIK
jgi:beta-glucanase (GH16 family)